jgi:[ribosomal protein S18]-alanine N-acetyltransferase
MPAPEPILRAYRSSDFETLLAIDKVCFPKSIAYGRHEMRSYLQAEGAHCIVAELFGEVAGFILTERSNELAHIITLDVIEEHRRCSVGSRLLEAAEQEAASQGAALMYLETATTNKAAIALWRKHGYRETATIENYYGRGQHAFEMQKLLPHEGNLKAKNAAES